MNFPESVAGVVFSSDRSSVLMIQRRDVPVWVLPGGGIEPCEPPEEAVIREILEETGFTVKAQRLVGVYTPVNRLAKHTFLYECAILKGRPTPSNESKKVQFFPLASLPKLVPPPYREWIGDALLHDLPVKKPLASVNYKVLFLNLARHPILVLRFLLARLGWTINT